MNVEEILGMLRTKVPAVEVDLDGPGVVVVPPAFIRDVCRFLKENPALDFKSLMSLTVVDLKERFTVVYHLSSMAKGHKIALKVFLPRDQAKIDTVSNVWKTANWHEREAYDLFGVVFEGHPDLRRILLPDEWVGHPLRKDYVPQPDTAEIALGRIDEQRY
jgi:NADH-quinone oxidoreductase subunit C